MDATVSSLDKVRDAIHIIGACPGLGTIEFKVPTWTGVWKEAVFDTEAKTDDMIDAEMNELCASNTFSDASLMETSPTTIQPLPKKYRAAETSEIMLKAIDGLPQTNTAGVPLMGTCPNCQGDPDEAGGPQHASGHARVCWQPDSFLLTQYRNTDCSSGGLKAVICVEEIQLPTAPKSTEGIPLGCELWYDGCHTCVVSGSQLGGCSVGSNCIYPGVQPYCASMMATIPPGCSTWYDGCKQCSVNANGLVQACTPQNCTSLNQASCLDFELPDPATPSPTPSPTGV
jgi:hypothetical protein